MINWKVFTVAFLLGGVTGFFSGLYLGSKKSADEDSENEVETPEPYIPERPERSNISEEVVEFQRYFDKTKIYRAKIDDEPAPDDSPNREPFEISLEEFRNEYPDSNEETVTWYRYDEVLADSLDRAIPEQMDIIGPVIDVLNTTSKDVIYIHNDEFDTNYEVIIEPFAPYVEPPFGYM